MDFRLPELPGTDYEKQKKGLQEKAKKAHKELLDYRQQVERQFKDVLADVDERIKQTAKDAGITNAGGKRRTAAAKNPRLDGDKVVAYIEDHGGSVSQEELMDAFSQNTAHKFGGLIRQETLKRDDDGNYEVA